MKILQNFILFAILLISSSSALSAKHILGSELVYTCNSEENYTIDLIMYRDCYAGGALFDTEISITIFNNGNEFQVLDTELDYSESLEYNPYENCEPNADLICVEKGIYTFDLDLPISEFSYVIAHQRCCWANDIINILEPEYTGVTIEGSISPEAQSIFNSTYPLGNPLVVMSCPNVPLYFNLPIFDEEGDSLSYEICTTLQGGGNLGASENPGDPTLCNGLIPSPACLPFKDIMYSEGFSSEYPFPTENGININAETGTLEFIPTETGRYIFSICVSEYRDGVYLGLKRPTLQLGNVVMPLVNTISDSLDKVEVYYAPSNASIHIEKNGILIKDLQVFNISGQAVDYISSDNPESSVQIPIGKFQIGTYIILLSDQAGNVQTKKIVKY